MRVLVVDDEKALVKGIKFNLELDGFEVDTAFGGVEAVEKVRAGGIDLIIMDLMMPKKNGLDAIHDTVHEMARDEARHGKALEGLLNRYFK